MKIITARRSFAVVTLSLTLAACGQADPFLYDRQQLQYQAEQQQQQQSLARSAFLEPFNRALLVGLMLSPLLLIGIGLDSYRLRRRLVAADAAGKLPMPRRVIEQDARPALASIAAFHATELARATPARTLAAPVPSVPALIENSQQSNNLPGLTDLASLAFQPSLQSILLGIGPGGVRYEVHAKDLVHLAVAGQTNGGKSNIMRLILSQLVATGARVVLADPHYCPIDVESGEDWRPIERRLHLAPAVSASAIGDLFSWLALDELPQRLERRRNGQSAGVPIFCGADELAAIVADVPKAPEYMGRILREGRKAGIFLCTASQDWLVKSVGGSGAVRDNFRTAFYTGGDTTSARVLLDIVGRVDDGQLGQGLAFLRSKATPTAQLVRVPLASNEALHRLLDVSPIGDSSAIAESTTVVDMPAVSQSYASADVATTALEAVKPSTAALSAEQQRILGLFAAGSDVAAIVREVYDVSSNSGRLYQDKSREVQMALRAALATA